MSLTAYGKVLAVQGAADGLLSGAGGKYQVRLYNEGVELSGNGYARAYVETLGPPVQVDGGAEVTITFTDSAVFTASGGNLVYDEVRYYSLDGVNKIDVIGANGTILDGQSESMNPTINYPRDDAQNEGRVSLARFGRNYASDPTFDNALSIANGLKAKRNGYYLSLYVPPGRWHVTTADIFSFFTPTELELVRGIHIYGSRPEDEQQGNLTSGLDPITTLSFDLNDDTEAVFKRRFVDGDSTTFFGIITFENLHILADYGSFGSFIDLGTEDDIAAEAAFRGLIFEHSYLSYHDHPWYAGATGRPWIKSDANAGCDIFDPSRVAAGVTVKNGYDMQFHSCVWRGWPVAFRSKSAENLIMRDCRFILCSSAYVKEDGGTVGVQDNVFAIAPDNVGIWSDTGVFTGPNVETGYPFTPSVGAYACGSSPLTWSIAANSSRLELDMSACHATRQDARYYLRDHSIVKIVPTEWETDYVNQVYTAMPDDWLTGLPLYLALTNVDATGADILYGGLDINNVPMAFNFPVTIGGDGAGLIRCCGVNGFFYGDEVALHTPVWNRNLNIGTDTPLAAFAPLKRQISINGEIQSADLDTAGQKLILPKLGGQNYLGAGLAYGGCKKLIDHPLSHYDSEYPDSDANTRKWITWFRSPLGDVYKYAACPGRGISAANNQSAELFFRRATEPDPDAIDPTVYPWVYRVSDGVTGRRYQPQFPSFASAPLYARVWSDRTYNNTGSPSAGDHRLKMWDGVANQYFNLVPGWQTIPFTLAAGATAVWLMSGWSGATPVLDPDNAGQRVEVAWVGHTKLG